MPEATTPQLLELRSSPDWMPSKRVILIAISTPRSFATSFTMSMSRPTTLPSCSNSNGSYGGLVQTVRVPSVMREISSPSPPAVELQEVSRRAAAATAPRSELGHAWGWSSRDGVSHDYTTATITMHRCYGEGRRSQDRDPCRSRVTGRWRSRFRLPRDSPTARWGHPGRRPRAAPGPRPGRPRERRRRPPGPGSALSLSLIHISEPTRLGMISYAVFCLKKKKTKIKKYYKSKND